MGKPSKYEKETIINFNEGEKEASVYTFNADLKRRLAEFSRKYPLLCRLEKSTPEGSVTYVLDKSRLSIRLVPPYSEERREAARAYAKEHGFKTVDDLLTSSKTCPEESIYQIGTVEESVPGELLAEIAVEFFAEMEERFGSHVHILDWALHLDEGTPHIHERHVFDCKNKYGELCP